MERENHIHISNAVLCNIKSPLEAIKLKGFYFDSESLFDGNFTGRA